MTRNGECTNLGCGRPADFVFRQAECSIGRISNWHGLCPLKMPEYTLGVMTLMLLVTVLLTATTFDSTEIDKRAARDQFENEIRPLLVKHCYSCHSSSASDIKGGLALDSRAGWVRGGQSGEVIVPGDASQSRLIRAVRYTDPDLQMPPTGKLKSHEIASLRHWIASGAFDPREKTFPDSDHKKPNIDVAQQKQFWAFQLPQKSLATRVDTWSQNPIDRFIAEHWEKEGLRPVSIADSYSFLRRVSFDLVGLPPSQQMISQIDTSVDTSESIVDQLLASPQFGERWARHWLDVVRYASSVGSTRNYVFSYAWRYRNYVIDSLNADKPYDQFVREQVAGDLLPADSEQQRIDHVLATGFLGLGVRNLGEQDAKILRSEEIAEQIDTLGRAFLGLNLICARCHDHKFAPISTEDYHGLAGIFQSTEILSGFGRLGKRRSTVSRNDLLVLAAAAPRDEFQQAQRALTAELEEMQEEIEYWQLQKRVLEDAEPFDKKALEQCFATMRELKEKWRKLNASLAVKFPLAMAVRDTSTVANVRIQIGGDPYKLGPEVQRGFLEALHSGDPIPADSSGRMELAKWLSSRNNPLVARVFVNRVWHHLFGRGLVTTVDDFTPSGSKPSHPKLLDYLAVSFMDNDWSLKYLIRQIVLSRVYRLSTAWDSVNKKVDPENRYLWRMNRRRLEAESLRDSLLAASGKLDLRRPKNSLIDVEWNRVPNEPSKWVDYFDSSYRTVYLPVFRRALPAMLKQFDFAPPDQVVGARSVTTVPTQALFLMNSPFVVDCSSVASKRLLANYDGHTDRVRALYIETVGRTPSNVEQARTYQYVFDLESQGITELEAWSDVYHAIFSSAEFLYLN